MKFKKKPVIIDAIQFDGNKESMKRIIIDLQMPHGSYEPKFDGTFRIKTLEGTMMAIPGDWIIKGVASEFYPCKDTIFKLTYEKVEE